MPNRFETYFMLHVTIHIILPKQTNFKIDNLAFVIMSTRENIRLIARASLFMRFIRYM